MNRYLNDVKAEHAFVLQDGRRLRNVHELKDALAHMHLDTFRHHVREGKNDFSRWIHDCIKDTCLAEKIAATTSKEHMVKVIGERITELVRQRQPGAHLARGPFTEPLATDHIIHEIEMLSKGFSTENVITAVQKGNIVTDIGARGPGETGMKESDAGIVVLRKKSELPHTTTNRGAAPHLARTSTHPQAAFFEKLILLMRHIDQKDVDLSREIYTELKHEYERTSFSPQDQKAVHGILKSAYHDIITL